MGKTSSKSAVSLKLVAPEPAPEAVIRVDCVGESQVNPKIAQFLAEKQPATPCLVVDLDAVAHSYHLLRWYLPLAKVFYAVKANPAAEVVSMLSTLGSSFDVASRGEV